MTQSMLSEPSLSPEATEADASAELILRVRIDGLTHLEASDLIGQFRRLLRRVVGHRRPTLEVLQAWREQMDSQAEETRR